jgi:carboxyl-terminal processing protease
MSLKRVRPRAMIAGAVLGAGLVTGGMFIQSGVFRQADAATGSPHLLNQVMARVLQSWIDTISADELFRRTASGLVREVDDAYSTLLTPDRYRRLRESTTGRYAGVGVELDMRDGFVTVIAALARTPADSAGIKPGDQIVAIDGKSTLPLSMEEVQLLLRGPKGTKVSLTLARDEENRTVTLTRREIVYHPVQRAENLGGNIGYVELATFSEHAANELRRTVDSLRALGAVSLILDLRENPGGLLEQGIEVADLFLDQGLIISSTRGRTPDANQEFDDDAAQPWPEMPVVVLVDSGTASAAEIVAGALQDHKRAVILGSPTYGKGSAQSLFPILGGRALKLTTARWFTPEGRTIERDSTKGGITPDIEQRKPLAAAPVASVPLALETPLALDPVIARALELLTGVTRPDDLRARIPKARRS